MEFFYAQLEEIQSLDPWALLKQLKPFEVKLVGVDIEKLKTEKKVLAFSLNNGELYPKVSNVNVNGETSSYPNTDFLELEEIDYLKGRLSISNNTWIRSRYAHVLWTVTRNNQFADIAIKSYMASIDLIINSHDPKSVSDVLQYVECLLHIGERTKLYISQIKSKILGLIKSYELPSFLKVKVLELATKCKIFKPVELVFCLELCTYWLDLNNSSSYFLNQSICNLAISLSEKNNLAARDYYRFLAENEGFIIQQHPDEKDFIRYISYGNMAKYYKKSGDKAKYEELLKEYTRLKLTIELGLVETSLPDKETEFLNDFMNKKSELILGMPFEAIMSYLATGDDLLISEEVLDEKTKKVSMNSIHNLFSTSVFDINTNHKLTSETDSKQSQRFNIYAQHYNILALPLIIKILAFGIMNGKINYHSVFRFLEENSWFGQRFGRGTFDRDIDKDSNWLSLFAPGLYDFFYQFEWAVIMSNNKIPNYVLCVDSLTLKFEGALRDFIRILGGSTTIEKREELQEQLLEDLLQNPIVFKNFSKEDLTLFRYVFTKSGWNIRHNVAHCFYPYSSYSFDKAVLILLCILRLGKYKIVANC